MPIFDNRVDLHVKQEEAYTAQVYWFDDYDNPLPVVGPAQMDVRTNDVAATLVLRCEDTVPDPQDAERGYLKLSDAAGLIEIYIPGGTLALIPPGVYVYDLFANYRRYLHTAGETDWGDYHTRAVLNGQMIVHPAVTQNPPRRADD